MVLQIELGEREIEKCRKCPLIVSGKRGPECLATLYLESADNNFKNRHLERFGMDRNSYLRDSLERVAPPSHCPRRVAFRSRISVIK